VLGLALGVLVITGLSAGGLQTRFKTSSESIRPKFSKISPLQGLKRLFSIRAVIDLVKGILKISLIAGVLFMVLYPQLGGLSVYSQLSPSQVLVKLQGLMGKSVIAVFVIMTIIAALDYIYERFKFTQELRMTREELKQEIKNTEGDPMIKGRLKQMRRDRSRQKMLAAVPSATVVLTNPTHYAVALFYDPATMDAPEVVAKGVEFMAQTIRELATKHKVPIVRNPALARKLYDDVELNESIPQSHYKAVAEVIRYVMALKR
jgi:flagellar biosynthetic protein FlhB